MKKSVLVLSGILLFSYYLSAQNPWVQKSGRNELFRFYGVSFTIKGKAYVGLGQNYIPGNLHDFWEYDPAKDNWTQKKDYPGKGSYAATAFAINGKGYVCLGGIDSSTNARDVWEYSPESDTWKQMKDFPGTARCGASSFVIGDTAFVGTGAYSDDKDYLNDMWMYVPATDTWSQIADFPEKRKNATSFAIGQYGYIGSGLSDKSTATKEFWKYDKSNSKWIRIADFPGRGRTGMASFIANGSAWVGSGYDLMGERNDFYEYSITRDSWISFLTVPLFFLQRQGATSFSIDNIGYVGLGRYAGESFFWTTNGARKLVAPTDTIGSAKDFWFGFMEAPDLPRYLVSRNSIDVTSSYDFNFTLYLGNDSVFSRSVDKNITISIDDEITKLGIARGSEKIPFEKKAFHLVADQPVSVIAKNQSDAAFIYPTEFLGTEYFTMCFNPYYATKNNPGYDSRNSEFLVVATQNNTHIDITPSVTTDQGKEGKKPFSINLSRGEVYQVQSGNLPNSNGKSYDLTGSYIKSDKPIAVFSGNYSTSIPAGLYLSNHLYEQMPSLPRWGKKFITVPFDRNHLDYYRVLSSQDNTIVRIGNNPINLLKSGEFYDFDLTSPTLIESNQPILVAQFSRSAVINDIRTPFMVIQNPIDHTYEKATFSLLKEHTDYNLVNLIVKNDAIGLIQITDVNGTRLIPAKYFKPIDTTGYSFVQINQINPTGQSLFNSTYPHLLESIDPGKGFIAYGYGLGGTDSYGYNIGYNQIKELKLNLPGTKDEKGDKTLILCSGNEPYLLDAGAGFQKYQWNTLDTTQSIRIAKEGMYSVTATTSSGETQSDSVRVLFSEPMVNLGPDLKICGKDSVYLDAGAGGFIGYSWTTPLGALTGSKINASKTGSYIVEAVSQYGCKARDTINVSFFDKPKISFDKLDTLICGKFNTTLNISADKQVSWKLESPSPRVQVNNFSVSISPPEEGIYPITFTATDDNSCATTENIRLNFYNLPILELGPDTAICDRKDFVLSPSKQFDGYNWSTTETTPSITIKNNGSYGLTVRDNNGCKASDSVKISFADPPQIDLSQIDTLICGKFSTTLDVSANENVIWSLKSTNPKVITSGLTASVSPSDFGSYPLILTAKNQSSCTASANFKVGFYKTPKVGFNVDDKTCSGYNLQVKYVGDADAGIADFDWSFGGERIAHQTGLNSLIVPLGINRSGRDLSLKVNEHGCDNSYTLKNIKVIPNLDLHVSDTLGCAPFSPQFVAENTEQVTYDWDFGDGTPVQRKESRPTWTYRNPGYYDVKLKIKTIVSNGDGCYNEVKMDHYIHAVPVPTAAFTPVLAECLEPGAHELSYSGTGDASDRYIWDLKELSAADIINNPNETKGPLVFDLVSKPQATIGLKAISKFGCQSDAVSTLVKRKPVFTVNSSVSSGCTPLEVIFTGHVTDPVDKVTYSWDFGDGHNGSGNTINHVYENPDHQYDVGLTTSSSVTGCSSSEFKKEFITTRPKPEASFNMDYNIVYNDKPTVNFTNSSKGATTYTWDFGDGSTSNFSDPSHSFTATGYKTVLMEAFNDFLCSDTVSHQVLIAMNQIFPPNAFSPNAPNAIDRTFLPTSAGVKEEGYHLTIFSRWNDVVFESRNELRGWDGRMKNGDFAPAGNYLWILNFTDFLGRTHRQTGTVTVIY